jgi:hypothetical protein
VFHPVIPSPHMDHMGQEIFVMGPTQGLLLADFEEVAFNPDGLLPKTIIKDETLA